MKLFIYIVVNVVLVTAISLLSAYMLQKFPKLRNRKDLKQTFAQDFKRTFIQIGLLYMGIATINFFFANR